MGGADGLSSRQGSSRHLLSSPPVDHEMSTLSGPHSTRLSPSGSKPLTFLACGSVVRGKDSSQPSQAWIASHGGGGLAAAAAEAAARAAGAPAVLARIPSASRAS